MIRKFVLCISSSVHIVFTHLTLIFTSNYMLLFKKCFCNITSRTIPSSGQLRIFRCTTTPLSLFVGESSPGKLTLYGVWNYPCLSVNKLEQPKIVMISSTSLVGMESWRQCYSLIWHCDVIVNYCLKNHSIYFFLKNKLSIAKSFDYM